MRNHTKFTWILVGVALIVVGLLALSALAAPRPTLAQRPLPASFHSPHNATTVSTDEVGYTLWTVDWSDSDWCVPYSRIAYPLDLTGYDTSVIADASLILTYSQTQISPHGYTDPTWTVALNGSPPTEWRPIGSISGPVNEMYVYSQWTTAEIPFPDEPYWFLDGENKLYLRQHDFCPTDGLPDAACTCVDIHTMQLRAALALKVTAVSPDNDARNLRGNTPVRVRFSRPVIANSVNTETFQLYYYDQQLNRVYVDAVIRRLARNEFTLTPIAPLRPGVRYYAQIWGKDEADEAGRDAWVVGPDDFILEQGRAWSFWTLPDVQVELVPVQVLENMPLIVNKTTALRVFIHWEYHEDIYALDQVELIEVHDLSLRWQALQGSHNDGVHWRDDKYGWNLPYTFDNARRKREYRVFNTLLDSYDKFERMAGRDSVTYFGFIPLDSGTYDLSAVVTVLDHQGEPTLSFHTATQWETQASRRFNLHHRAVAVGSDFAATGARDLHEAIQDGSDTLRALFPVPSVTRPTTPGAMPFYHPTTSLWIGNWADIPSWPYYRQHRYLLHELSLLCARTTDCDAMIGYVPQDWLIDIGRTLPESAPQSALVQHNTTAYYAFNFVQAHEIGHLYGFEHDEHLDLRGGEGYHLGPSFRRDLRSSVAQLEPKTQRTLNAIYDFMHVDPVELPPTDRLWIHPSRYQSLLNRITGGPPLNSVGSLGTETTPLLLVSGIITPTNGETLLLPWYELEPGPWRPPTPGPYEIAFLDAGGAAIAGYTRAFTVTTRLQSAGGAAIQSEGGATFFTLKIPYPPNMTRVQIRRSADNALLAERLVSAAAPSLTLHSPAPVWSGEQMFTWSASPNTHFAVDVSADGGATWEALAINLDAAEATFASASLPNTTQAHIRVAATDGLRTTTQSAGPFTIANPPTVSYVSPSPGGVGDPTLALEIGFRDAMDAATIHEGTITLNGGPYGAVSGEVRYDPIERLATFTPRAPLAYDTVYTAQVSAQVRDSAGVPLPAPFTWTFSIGQDMLPPVPLLFSPPRGAQRVPIDTAVATLWNKPLDPASLTPARFTLATVGGTAVAGNLLYNAATRSLTFQPAAHLLPNTLYIARLHTGIADLAGNATSGEYLWTFRTGAAATTGPRFTGAYADWGVDVNGDGLYDQLMLQVGVQTAVSGAFTLHGVLADAAGEEIGWAQSSVNLAAGAQFIPLAFAGAEIGGRGVDGPYTLARLTLTAPDGQVIWAVDTYRTFAYAAAQFPAPLRFGGLPDLLLRPETNLTPAFNVRDYAQHATQPSAALTYTLLENSNPRLGVTLDAGGNIHVSPEPGWGIAWTGETRVTLQASYGAERVQDTFSVAVGWQSQIYLPLILRQAQAGGSAAQSYWQIAYQDDFEQEPLIWERWASHYGLHSYMWARRNCAAHSGSYSVWAFGGGADGSLLPCGAHYPQTEGHSSMRRGPYNLRYTSQAEFRLKVWTDFAPGDEVCAMVSLDDTHPINQQYYGVCRSGKTNGWEDLVLDLANVPTLGNVLGQEVVWLAVRTRIYGNTSRPVGAYIDDAELRLCPVGINCRLSSPSDWTSLPVGQATAVSGSIGGYGGEIESMVLGRQANGRLHALWTGRLNPHFDPFVYYASSIDGVNWTPFQILSYAAGDDPRIAVDDGRQRVHLMYRAGGIVHRVVTGGVVSSPVTVAHSSGEWGGPRRPQLTVAPTTGHVHAVWQDGYFRWLNYPTVGVGRELTWYAYWDGAAWSERRRVITDDDTWDAGIAAGADGGIMLAWFQRWQQSQPLFNNPGEPTVPRTAYGLAATPGRFPLRQAVSPPYTLPERDAAIQLSAASGDSRYILLTEHRMWPGHTRVYRYAWANETWSAPLNVAQNPTGWAMPVYVGAATSTPLIRYVYSEGGTLKMRSETNGVLGAPQTVADYLSARGFSGVPKAYFTDAAGNLHLLLDGTKNGVPGVYYVAP